MAEKLSPTTQWILGVLFAVLAAFWGYFARSIEQSVDKLTTQVSVHVASPGHAVSMTKLEALEQDRKDLHSEIAELNKLLREALAKRMAYGLPNTPKGDS